jgi:hypothetical protein
MRRSFYRLRRFIRLGAPTRVIINECKILAGYAIRHAAGYARMVL